ncbi:MAG: hypothetical protein AAFX90_15460 [Pseudomonadota bacterium]
MFRSIVAAFAAMTLTSAAFADLTDDQQVPNAINNVGYYADQGDWDQVAAQFHPEGAVLDHAS